MDNDGIDNWEENMTCTLWNVSDTDGGGINDGDELTLAHSTDPCVSTEDVVRQIMGWDSANSVLNLNATKVSFVVFYVNSLDNQCINTRC